MSPAVGTRAQTNSSTVIVSRRWWCGCSLRELASRKNSTATEDSVVDRDTDYKRSLELDCRQRKERNTSEGERGRHHATRTW